MDNAYSKNLHLKARQFCRERFLKCGSLYRKDLFGHYGCVNAVEFSHDGQWLVSGLFAFFFISLDFLTKYLLFFAR